jgi:nephrocystin-3
MALNPQLTKNMKTLKSREVRVFISSSFRGMFKEREVLVRHVFPEIRRRCFERGVGFAEVEAQRGITTEQVDLGFAVPICFQQIDNCQPFFIGLLGEYYGSTIKSDQVETACQNYPWIIEQNYLDRSITELEMIYALFKRPVDQQQTLAKNALFYFRSPNYANTLPLSERKDYIEASPENRDKQQNLKQRLRDHGCQIAEYKQPSDLKELILESLWEKIAQEFPDTPTSQQQEDFEHDAFALSRQSVYIKRQSDFDRLTQHALSDEPPLLITGESGCGKTALLANWAKEYQQAHPDDLVFWHFCGSSPASSDPLNLLRRIMASLKSRFNVDKKIPSTAEEIKEQFGIWLGEALSRVILIIDGLNQLEDTTRGWLHSIPANTRLITSTISADDDRLPEGCQTLSLPLLTEKAARQALITDYLKQYGKTLSAEAMQGLLDAPQTANPLYLRIILEELRIFGNFDKLGEHLKAHLQAETIPELYQKVLVRLEEDYQPAEFEHLVKNALSLLWAARQGLNESEILAILKVPQAIWSPLYLALQNALVSRRGLLDFFHDYLRQAVETMYLNSPETKQAVHRQLADYFEQQSPDARIADELPYQLEQAGELPRLQACLSEIPLFLCFEDDKSYELMGYWERLGATEKMVAAAYNSGLSEYEQSISEKEVPAGVLDELASFFRTVGYFSSAEPLFRQALAILKNVLPKEHPHIASSMNNLAILLSDKGDYDAAEPLYREALAIYKNVLPKEHPYLASSMINLANLLKDKGDYDNAYQLYHQALAIFEVKLGYDDPKTLQVKTDLKNLPLTFKIRRLFKSIF